jgi:hypothetical protein
MDAPLDAASTSDADEREVLESANFDLYWDGVVAKSQAKSRFNLAHHRPPNALSDPGDDM